MNGKFRLWDNDNDVYSYVDLSNLDDAILTLDSFREYFSFKYFEQHKNYIQHSTGIKDRKGKDIYVGDILNCYNWGHSPADELLTVSIVEYDKDDKGWGISPDPTDGDRYDLFRNVEVVGNMFENPTLLEK